MRWKNKNKTNKEQNQQKKFPRKKNNNNKKSQNPIKFSVTMVAYL